MDEIRFYDYKEGNHWYVAIGGIVWSTIVHNKENEYQSYDPDEFLLEDGKTAKVPNLIYKSALFSIKQYLEKRNKIHDRINESIITFRESLKIKCEPINDMKEFENFSDEYKLLKSLPCDEPILDDLINSLKKEVDENLKILEIIETNIQME